VKIRYRVRNWDGFAQRCARCGGAPIKSCSPNETISSAYNIKPLSFIHFHARFSSWECRGAAALGGLKIPHGEQQC